MIVSSIRTTQKFDRFGSVHFCFGVFVCVAHHELLVLKNSTPESYRLRQIKARDRGSIYIAKSVGWRDEWSANLFSIRKEQQSPS